MILDYLRLAFGTALVFLPGLLIARALGQRTTSAMLAWALAAQFVSWAVVFTVHGSIVLQLVLLLVLTAASFAVRIRHKRRDVPQRAQGLVLGGGVLLGIALWHVEGPVTGDGLFHEGRVRKLVDLGNLHLRTLDELAKGGLHPGYAFPLWHGLLADIAKLSGLDPEIVIRHESSLLVPIACVVAWESGVALFGSVAGGLSVLAASLGLYCFAGGHGGAYTSLALPATAGRQLLVPAAIALFFGFASTGRRTDLAALAAVLGSLALVHSSYALFLLVPLGAYAVVRWPEWRRSLVGLVVGYLPVALVLLWLRPLVDETLSHNPSKSTVQNSLEHYGGEIVGSPHHFHLSSAIYTRAGAVAVAALFLVPLAGFAARKRWGALVLGGTIAVLALTLIPLFFVHFSDAVSISQARRVAGFIPFPFAFAGGLAIVSRSIFVTPLALVAGIVLQWRFPGDFAYGLDHGGPGIVAWWALVGGVVALVAGLVWARPRRLERYGRGAAAAWLFVLPVAVHGFLHWSPAVKTDPHALSPSLLRELQRVPARAVIIGPLQTSYELVARAPVYVVAAPPTHVAATRANNPYVRRRQVDAWLAGRAPLVPRMYGATWAVNRRGRLYPLQR